MRLVRWSWLPTLLVVAGAGPVAALQGGPFTLDQLLGVATPVDMPAAPSLVPSPAGARVAWVLNVRGERNLWVAEAPEFRGRPITRHSGDDGVLLGATAWLPDGRSLLYVRGGDGNSREAGAYPNPRSDPAGGRREIWLVSIAGGEPRRVAEGAAPAVSPRGDLIAFLRRDQLWLLAPDAPEREARPVVIKGTPGSLTWSPDGARLAFVSQRGDHSFIGVYDRAAGTVRYLDAGVDRDQWPAWSPDGTRIAFVRVPGGAAAPFFLPRPTGEPWSIRVAEVASGRGREVWRAAEGKGSVFRPTPRFAEIGSAQPEQLHWVAGERIVFPWEGDGWLRLYAVPATGGTAAALTPAACAGDGCGFEVEQVSLSPDRRELVYASNQGDIDRRHLWRVSVAGGAPVQVTTGEGVEWGPVHLRGAEAIAYLRQTGRRPVVPVVRTAAGEREMAPITLPAGVREDQLAVPEPVVFAAGDGRRVHGILFRPPGAKAGERHPAVVHLHGGPLGQMPAAWWGTSYHKYYAANQYLASRGFLVLSVNFRRGTGYGLAFREAERSGGAGASELDDVLGAGRYLRARPDVDPARIGVYGGSYGGYLTALALARASHVFAAGVDLFGVHDFTTIVRGRPDQGGFAPGSAEERLAFESSPMAWVHEWRSPVLVIHAGDDRNTPFSQAVELVAALRRRKVDVEVLVHADEVHSWLTYAAMREGMEATVEFLERRLRDAPAPRTGSPGAGTQRRLP